MDSWLLLPLALFFLPMQANMIRKVLFLTPTYTKKCVPKNWRLNCTPWLHKNVLLRELSFQNILGATPPDCFLRFALTWSLMHLDKLTTVVYWKQKETSSVYSWLCVFNLSPLAAVFTAGTVKRSRQTLRRISRTSGCPLGSTLTTRQGNDLIGRVTFQQMHEKAFLLRAQQTRILTKTPALA